MTPVLVPAERGTKYLKGHHQNRKLCLRLQFHHRRRPVKHKFGYSMENGYQPRSDLSNQVSRNRCNKTIGKTEWCFTQERNHNYLVEIFKKVQSNEKGGILHIH